MDAIPLGLPPPVHLLPQAPEFPLEVTTEWRFVFAICVVANAVAFAVQAFFEGQALFSGGFVFLGLSALFGIYYLFQARALEGHVTALAQECGTKQQSIDGLARENARVQQEKGQIQDQSRGLVAAISEWYAAAILVADHGLPQTQDRVLQARALIQKYHDLTRDIAALTQEDAKRQLLADLAQQRTTNALRSAELLQQSEQVSSREEAIELRERTFASKQEKFAEALQALGFSSTKLHELSEAVSKVAEEVSATAKETARALNIRLQTPRDDAPKGAAFQRLLTITNTPSKPGRHAEQAGSPDESETETDPASPTHTPLANETRQETEQPDDGEHE